jgi:hypothetical protein
MPKIEADLTDREIEVLDEISAKMDLSRTAVLRQALRLYQAVNEGICKVEWPKPVGCPLVE